MRFIYSAAMFYYFWFHIMHIIRLNKMLVFPHRGKLRTIFSQILNFFLVFLSQNSVVWPMRKPRIGVFFSIFCSALFLCSHSSCYLLLFSFFKRDFDRQHTHTQNVRLVSFGLVMLRLVVLGRHGGASEPTIFYNRSHVYITRWL